MNYLSVCSGIEAATVAWPSWTSVAFVEIDKFPAAVLAHHYPDVPNLGDMTKFKEWPDLDIDLLVGGTPCQSFSVAGLRKGLADPRGNLMLTYLAIADRYQPEWVVWENVPGVLSSAGGRDFGTFLGALGALGYGFAYRVLDAQFFGVPQRRRRVFVVGHFGDWRRAAAVLFERHSLQGHPPPSREKREGTTYPVAPCIGASGRGFERAGDTRGNDAVVACAFGGNNQAGAIDVSTACNAYGGTGRMDFESETFIAFDCKASGQNGFGVGEIASTMRSMGHTASHQNGGGHQVVAVNIYGGNKRVDRPEGGFYVKQEETTKTLDATGGLNPTAAQGGTAIMSSMQVRRLTPRECERLQGFPDDYTLIPFTHGKPAADGPRYKALGNSMAVPVMRWIGERIYEVECLDVSNYVAPQPDLFGQLA